MGRSLRLLQEWYYGVRDVRRVRRAFPQLASYRGMVRRSRRDLQPYYHEYVTTVSTPVMSISLELAAFLDVLCMVRAPRRLLDLGSGFSSLVLRRYVARTGAAAEVQSVDHDAEWLTRTGRYLERHQVDASGLSAWDEFRSREHAPFDLILHDLGGFGDDHIGYRLSVLPEVLELLAPDGVLILDDAHLLALGPPARRVLKTSNYRCWSLKHFVGDRFGRWALIAAR